MGDIVGLSVCITLFWYQLCRFSHCGAVKPHVSAHLQASFVLCRVFIKSCGRSNVAEIGLSSVAQDSIPTPDNVQTAMVRGDSVDRMNDSFRYPMRLVSELDDTVMPRAVPPSSQIHEDVPRNEQVANEHVI